MPYRKIVIAFITVNRINFRYPKWSPTAMTLLFSFFCAIQSVDNCLLLMSIWLSVEYLIYLNFSLDKTIWTKKMGISKKCKAFC